MASPTGQTGLGKYPHQVVILVSDSVANRIADDAATYRLSKSQVARAYIDAGIAQADVALAHAAYDAKAKRAADRAAKGR